MTQIHRVTRRNAIKLGAGTAALPLCHIRTAGAAGKLTGAAPPAIATQIASQATMPKMIARVTQSGMSIEQSIAVAEQELEGFAR